MKFGVVMTLEYTSELQTRVKLIIFQNRDYETKQHNDLSHGIVDGT